MLTYAEVQLFTCPGGGKNKQTMGQDLHTCVHTHGACGAEPLLGQQLLSMKPNTVCVYVCATTPHTIEDNPICLTQTGQKPALQLL